MKQREQLDRLELRHLRARAARTASRNPSPAPSKPAEPPVINVTVQAPEQAAPVIKVENKGADSPRRWVFKHRYDDYGKLVETTATAQ